MTSATRGWGLGGPPFNGAVNFGTLMATSLVPLGQSPGKRWGGLRGVVGGVFKYLKTPKTPKWQRGVEERESILQAQNPGKTIRIVTGPEVAKEVLSRSIYNYKNTRADDYETTMYAVVRLPNGEHDFRLMRTDRFGDHNNMVIDGEAVVAAGRMEFLFIDGDVIQLHTDRHVGAPYVTYSRGGKAVTEDEISKGNEELVARHPMADRAGLEVAIPLIDRAMGVPRYKASSVIFHDMPFPSKD